MSREPGRGSNGNFAKLTLAAVLLCFAFSLVPAAPARAQMPVSDLAAAADRTVTKVLDTLKESFVAGAATAIVSSVNYFASEMAYQLAMMLVAECPGGKPCWETMSLGDALKSAGEGAVGTMVETLSKEGGFEKLGLNLCAPPTPNLMLSIQLGLLRDKRPPKPKCDFNTLVSNWSALASSLTDAETYEQMWQGFKPGTAPLSASFIAFDKTAELVSKKESEKQADRLMSAAGGGGYIDVKDMVSKAIKTPAGSVKNAADKSQNKPDQDKQATSNAMTTGQLAKGVFAGVLSNAVSTFAQTLMAQGFNRIVKGLLSSSEADLAAEPEILLSETGVVRTSTDKVAAAVKSRFSVAKVVESGAFDPVTSFSSCPSTNRGPDNCVMDSQFATAVAVSQGTVLTVRDALEKGMLHGDWPLISAKDTVRNTSNYCYTQGYCETNLKKLRAARIISIGWEIAARKSSVTSPTKLKEVIAGFDDCNDNGEADASHKWCHLIDPDWPLVQPTMMCRATVYGQQLASSEAATRAEVCVDKVTCLRQDDNGTCVGGYGYCTRERNIWRFNADSCPEYFASCRAYKPADGGAVVSYLANTIEHGSCNADNVGCSSYSTVRNAFKCDCSTPGACSGTVTGGVCKTAKGCTCTKDLSCTVAYGERRCLSSRGETCTIPSGACATPTGCLCAIKYACTVSDGSKYCTTTEGDDTTTEDDWLNTPARYFTDNAKSCTATDAGCTALIELDTDESLNLVRNGSFEELEDADGDGATDHPRYWIPFGKVPSDSYASPKSNSALATDGSYAVHVGPASGAVSGSTCTLTTGACATETGCNCVSGNYGCLVPWQETTCKYTNRLIQDGISVLPKRTYTLSADFRSSANISTASLPKLRLSFKDSKGDNKTLTLNDAALSGDEDASCSGPIVSGTPKKYCCTVNTNAVQVEGKLDSTDAKKASASCTFSVDADIAEGVLEIVGTSGVYVDSVMLEEGGGTGAFHEEYGDASTGVYAKVAPGYLGCTGDSTDDEECANYAAVCRENEVGCELYAPTNGDPNVPAVASDADKCPAACAGYDMFKQAATDFDQAKFPLYFIPSTATECSDSDVGCSEFTDLDTEAKSYYSKLRLCTDSTDTDVYYTWEGSDTTGYQLKVWNLKPTDLTMPQSNYDKCPGGGACANAGYAPCTQIKWVSGAMTCGDDGAYNATDANDVKGWCTVDDITAGDSDCRELTDQLGNRHYRRISRTVIAGTCSRLRATVSTQADCESSNGLWNSTRLDCTYRADATESSSCSASVNGCRSYQGNAAGNIRSILTDDFESGVGKWTGTAAESTESINLDGHSLKMANNSSPFSVQFTQYVQSLVGSGRFYTLQFWAKGAGTLKPRFDYGTTDFSCTVLNGSSTCVPSAEPNVLCTLPTSCASSGGCACTVSSGSSQAVVPLTTKACVLNATCTAAAGCACSADGKTCTVEQNSTTCNVTDVGVKLSGEWRSYQVGPIKAPTGFGTYPVRLTFLLEGTAAGDAFIDNIILKEVKDSTALVRNSWSTPISCDSTPDGAYSPRFMLGCREYTDSSKAKVYFRSFSQLCREQSVGCAAYSSMEVTADTPYAMTYNAVCKLDKACSSNKTNSPTYTGANCMCHYKFDAPFSGVAARAPIVDACRVAIGEKECRFDLEGVDKYSSRAHHPDSVLVPADSLMYLVIGKHTCKSSAVNCRLFAAPTLVYEGECKLSTGTCGTQGGCECKDKLTGAYRCLVKKGSASCPYFTRDSFAEEWTETSLLDDPSLYSKALCLEEDVGCESFTSQDGTSYFRDPGNKTCEYKEAAVYEGKDRSGWFRTSSSGEVFPCYPEILVSGDYYEIYKNADDSCSLDDVCDDADGCECKKKFCKLAASPYTATSQECYTNSDCSTGYQCDTAGTKICDVPRGERSCGYNGWVGKCEAKYDMCEEFVDPMATSAQHPKGEPYYYIVNSKLDKTTCAGTVSLKRGCVLFKQSSDTRNLYSAAATYFKVDKETPGVSAPVAPLNCDSSYPDNYCAKRCFSVQEGFCEIGNHSTDKYTDPLNTLDADKACYQDSDCVGKDTSGTHNLTGACVGTDTWGLGCSSNSDCTGKGEECVVYTGTPKNDTNVIIKVQPDRECAQWLACTDSDMNWDSDSGKWRASCTGFGLCEGFKKTGSGSECGKWSDESPEILTEQAYTGRDVSYRGLDYSGYSLYNKYQPQHLVVADIRQGFCVSKTDSTKKSTTAGKKFCFQDADCESGYECGPIQEGICVSGGSGTKGQPCDPTKLDSTKKYHEDCGSPDGLCSSSLLVTQRAGILGKHCGYCPADGGACTYKTTSCGSDGECAAKYGSNYACYATCDKTADCPSDSKGQAACVNGRCMFALSGGKMDLTSYESALQCRAYPESDAPFSREVLSTTGAAYTAYGLPQDRVISFQNANVCSRGEDCECSYRKVSYGKGGAQKVYYSYGTTVNEPPGRICVDGEYEGKSCAKDSDCQHCTTSGDPTTCSGSGTCTSKTGELFAQGWPGLCVDYDDTLYLNNNQNRKDCILWFPVDQLSGMPDRYNQYTEAGFIPDTGVKDIYYCQNAEGAAQGSGSDKYVVTLNNKLQKDGGDLFYDGDDNVDCYKFGTSQCLVPGVKFDQKGAGYQDSSGRDYEVTKYGIYKKQIAGIAIKTNKGSTMILHPGNKFTNSFGDAEDELAVPESGYIFGDDKPNYPSGTNDNCETKSLGGTVACPAGSPCTGKDKAGCDAIPATCVWKDNTCKCKESAESDAIGGSSAGTRCSNVFNWFINTNPPEMQTNPRVAFEVFCDDDCPDDGDGNFIAAKAYFLDSNDQLAVIRWGLCANTKGDVKVEEVKIYLRENCLEVAHVYDGDSTGKAGAPQTDNLFQLNSGKSVSGIPSKFAYSATQPWKTDRKGILPDQTLAPVGRGAPPILDTSSSPSSTCTPDNGCLPMNGFYTNTSYNLPIPVWSSEYGSQYSLFKLDQSSTEPTYQTDGDDIVVGGFPFACVDTCALSDVSAGATYKNSPIASEVTLSSTNGRDRLELVFAKAWGLYKWDGSKYKIGTAWDNRSSLTVAGMTPNGNQPAVVPADTLQCTESSVCVEGTSAGLTVNGRTRGDVESDKGAGKFKVSIKYYAFADKNHLPLRRKVVDYGDGSIPKSVTGYYKNHRGLHRDSTTNEMLAYCDDGTEWGMTSDSCDPRYFEEIKYYTCSNAMLQKLSVCSGKYPCKTSGKYGTACAYQPRVQVLDNWGVCNGSCPGGPGQGNTCMNTTLGTSPSTDSTVDECQADLTKFTAYSPIKPYTEFDGRILVYPKDE